MRKIFILAACIVASASFCGRNDATGGPEIPARPTAQLNDGDYTIKDGIITEKILRNYLSRAITEAEYLSSPGNTTDGYYGTDDDKRMLLHVGAKFIGRALYTWNGENKFNTDTWLKTAREKVDAYHAADPDAIFQGAIFETVSKAGVESITIPAGVFEAFGKTPEDRTFSFDAIRDEGGKYLGQWGKNTAVPDMSREEAQMWFYYVAVRYMEAGCEALHCGQVNLMCSMGDKENGYAGWRRMQALVREAAKTKARRGIVLMDAHCPGIVVDGKHLFDFASYPMRLREKSGSSTMEAELKQGYLDGIIGKTTAGITPSGWETRRLPYILEFDNFGTSSHAGEAALDHYVWGYDEISWIGLVTEDYARQFVREAVKYLEKTDPIGYLQMPGCRIAVMTNSNGHNPYRCNTRSEDCPTGRNLEETIKDIWK